MADDKTRVIRRRDAAATSAAAGPSPAIVDGQIVFFCPAGHRLVVPLSLAGKRGKCSKCSVPLQIPVVPASPAEDAPAAAEPPPLAATAAPPAGPAELAAVASPPEPATAAPPGDEGDWNFISGIATASSAPPVFEADAWSEPGGGHGQANPMARLLTRLWAERDHGGIVELHLVGGAVLLPEEFSPRWSGGSHGLFASQAADGSVTLTAIAWDTVQRIVVRQLTAVPDDLFD